MADSDSTGSKQNRSLSSDTDNHSYHVKRDTSKVPNKINTARLNNKDSTLENKSSKTHHRPQAWSGSSRSSSGNMAGNNGRYYGTEVSTLTMSKPKPNSILDINATKNRGNNNNKIPINGMNQYSTSFVYHLVKMESWSTWIGCNLLTKKNQMNLKGVWDSTGQNSFFVFLIRAFLFVYLFKELLGFFFIDPKDDHLMLYIGDHTNVYGKHVDRFAYNGFKFCWGLHAAIIYYWITRNNDKMRKWLVNFENRFVETAFCVNKALEVESIKKMESDRKFVTNLIHTLTLIAIANIILMNLYGYFYNKPDYLYNQPLEMGIYISWSLIHVVWFWITFVINLTAFGHHYLLCRAIHMRFDETKADFDYTILSDWSVYTEPEHISKLIAKHYYVCDMVKQANKHLKIYLFVFYIIFAPHLCFMVYQIIFSSNSTTQASSFT